MTAKLKQIKFESFFFSIIFFLLCVPRLIQNFIIRYIACENFFKKIMID